MEICTLTSEHQEWDDYVRSHSEGSFFHLSAWQKVVDEVFGHDCYFLYAKNEHGIVGVLPLVEVKSSLFGHALVSTPFCVYGGVVADNQEVKSALEAYACELAEQLQVDYLELRYRHEQQNNFILKQAHSTFGCEIADSAEDILANVKKKQRAVIRHSLKNELLYSHDHNIDDFYHLLSISYRNLGTPIFTKQYFASLIKHFQQDVDITTIKDKDNKLSNAVMNFYFNDQVLPYYGGGDANARALKSADFMYYQVLCHASEKGCKWYDFGRSKNGSGPYKYKKNWGMQPELLHYYYHLVNAKDLPNLSPNNPKYKLFIRMWQKLPLSISQWIGPFLSKYLG
ncbi:FemAB family PEP-CTERM system-associated protein [Thalassotalea sp. M1531]|uniref:FemAB family PEP-CTERM system-associated protein n=1 Tax=Thalassotalea algicola TaxID=2716224 RepID=A0A7Y0LF02_9GAMM|nr:FemAB family PEP-CTERM system-associated protein [Thalassotalea algicola]